MLIDLTNFLYIYKIVNLDLDARILIKLKKVVIDMKFAIFLPNRKRKRTKRLVKRKKNRRKKEKRD